MPNPPADLATPPPALRPTVWTPPADSGLTGPYAPNDRLLAGTRIPVLDEGPEDVVVAADGTIYTGTIDGSIQAVSADGDRVRRVAQTGGRPLGVELLPDGRLLVCDAYRGLLAVDVDTGTIEVLVGEHEGRPMLFTNNAAVATDGTIFFSDSSQRFSLQHYRGDALEHSGTGRLMRRDPDGTVTTVLSGLNFANGVALAPDESFVLVNETTEYRIRRLWLTGDRAGTDDVFATLPGFPDNLSTGPTGTFWVALFSTRQRLLDLLSSKPAVLRRIVWRIPERLQPHPEELAFVVGLDGDGTVVHNLQAHGDAFFMSTGAREHDGHLYVGSLRGDHLLRVPLTD